MNRGLLLTGAVVLLSLCVTGHAEAGESATPRMLSFCIEERHPDLARTLWQGIETLRESGEFRQSPLFRAAAQ